MKKMKKMLACLWGWQLTGLQKKTGTNTECKLLSYLLILFYKWQIMIDGLLLSYSYFFSLSLSHVDNGENKNGIDCCPLDFFKLFKAVGFSFLFVSNF